MEKKRIRILPGRPCGILASPKLPTERPELRNEFRSLGSEAELVAEMMCLVSRVEHANHATDRHPDGWSTE